LLLRIQNNVTAPHSLKPQKYNDIFLDIDEFCMIFFLKSKKIDFFHTQAYQTCSAGRALAKKNDVNGSVLMPQRS